MPRRDDLKKLIANYNRRLQKLKEQQALLGIFADPKYFIEIEDIEAEIIKLTTELEAISAEIVSKLFIARQESGLD